MTARMPTIPIRKVPRGCIAFEGLHDDWNWARRFGRSLGAIADSTKPTETWP